MSEKDTEKLKRITDAAKRDNEARSKIKEKVYEIGYKRSPISGQFKKDVSGNPKGRKKRTPPRTLLQALKLAFIKEVIYTNANGAKEKISLVEAFAQNVLKDAKSKDGPSRKLLLQDAKLLNFDFMAMLEDLALKDFEPEAPPEDLAWARDELQKRADKIYLNGEDATE